MSSSLFSTCSRKPKSCQTKRCLSPSLLPHPLEAPETPRQVNIAVQTYELVDKQIRKLDSDLAKFESEMKVSLALPTPTVILSS